MMMMMVMMMMMMVVVTVMVMVIMMKKRKGGTAVSPALSLILSKQHPFIPLWFLLPGKSMGHI